MPSSRRGLVVFDLDGTVLRGPTVCELLARPLGRLREMESFETLTSEAEIARARAEMVHWYAGIPRGRLLEPPGALSPSLRPFAFADSPTSLPRTTCRISVCPNVIQLRIVVGHEAS